MKNFTTIENQNKMENSNEIREAHIELVVFYMVLFLLILFINKNLFLA